VNLGAKAAFSAGLGECGMRSGSAFLLTGAAAVGALLVGSRVEPGPSEPSTAAWYDRLAKPEFTPPKPVFGAVWPVLDGLLWFAGYRIARASRSPARNAALAFWAASLACIPGYSLVFFGRKRPDEGLAVSAAMLGSGLGLAATARSVDRPAAGATLPLVAWLMFATVLQEEVWRRNK
jgi:tryptophan-rich sensory protein